MPAKRAAIFRVSIFPSVGKTLESKFQSLETPFRKKIVARFSSISERIGNRRLIPPRAIAIPLPMPTTSAPSRTRQTVIVFAVTLAIITYVDRVCISQSSGTIQSELGLSKQQMSFVFSAFTLAYALFEIPFGWLGDKVGPRVMLLRVVAMWSVFTALTGAVRSFFTLLVCRFCFGIGEAGCFPNITKIFTVWLPHRERVRAQGILWLSARWGGAFTPVLVVAVMSALNWRWTFALFGSLGIVWAIAFYAWFRDDPRKHPGVNAAELALLDGAEHNLANRHGQVPWARFCSNPSVLLLFLQYFCMNYGWYFFITWLPTYLKEDRAAALKQNNTLGWLDPILHAIATDATADKMKLALLAGIPLFFGGLGSLLAGSIAARIAKFFASTARARRVLGVTGLSLAAFMFVLSTRFHDPAIAMLILGAANFSNDLAMPGSWGAAMDMGGKFSGALSGAMNMWGQFGGFCCPIIVAQLLKLPGADWKLAFYASAIAYTIGAICWFFIDPVTPLDEPPSREFQ